MTLKEAKRNLKLISLGKKPKKTLTLEEAKINLIKADPGIDISKVIYYLHNRKYQKAFKELIIELAATPGAIEYFMPLLKMIAEKLI
jgi:hypothetical protein